MKTYTLIGACPLNLPDGQRVEPGTTFQAKLPVALEVFLTKTEAIKVAPEPKPAPKPERRVAPIKGGKE